jgi:hypothetical protein
MVMVRVYIKPGRGEHPLPGQLDGHHTNTDGPAENFYVMKPAAFGPARVAFQQISLVIGRQFLAKKPRHLIPRVLFLVANLWREITRAFA